MALKDLVAKKSTLTEAAIETLISQYVRYDPEEQEILFTPEAAILSNRQKVLVWFVAQQGWQFIVDAVLDVEVSPSVLGEAVGIPGGTLRPILKDLKDRHLLTSRAGRYSISSGGLLGIERELGGGPSSAHAAVSRRPKKASKRRHKGGPRKEVADGQQGHQHTTESKSSRRAVRGSKAAFDRAIREGFFDNGKTSADMHNHLQDRAFVVPRTSLPGYFLDAVRKERLTRSKQEVNGRTVWVYKTSN